MNDGSDFYKGLLDEVSDGIYCVDTNRCITFWNKAAERIAGYRPAEVLGTCCARDLLMHVNAKGDSLCHSDLCPAHKTIITGQTEEADEIYLHHKDGQRVPVHVRTSPLRDADGKITGAIEIFKEKLSTTEYEAQIRRLRELALIDPLTNIGNRRYGEIQMDSSLNELTRYQWRFGILFCDIDHFKLVNDAHGHDVGDAVLQMVAHTLSANTRSFDHVARWGGEEFLVVLVNIDEEKLESISEKLRVLVQRSFIKLPDTMLSVTLSIGATLSVVNDTREAIIKRADRLMYASKKDGRNKVTIG